MSVPASPSFNADRTDARALIILATLHVIFFVASLIVMPVLAPGLKIPNPFAEDRATHDLYASFGIAVRVSSFLQLLSAVCLAALGAFWIDSRARQRVSSAQVLIWVGSLGGGLLLSAAALYSWAIAAPGGTDVGAALHTLQFVPFLMGGPGWAAFFGLFLVGICRAGAAILPRWLILSGFFLAVVAELSTLVMLTITASVCLPIARFLGFIWLIAAAVIWARRYTKELLTS